MWFNYKSTGIISNLFTGETNISRLTYMDNPNQQIRKLHTDGFSLSLHLYIIKTLWENFIIKDCYDVSLNWIPACNSKIYCLWWFDHRSRVLHHSEFFWITWIWVTRMHFLETCHLLGFQAMGDGLCNSLLEFTFPYCAGAQLQSIYLFNSSLWVDNYPDVDNFYKKLRADPSYYKTMKKHDHLLGLALLATVWGIRLLLKQHWMHLLVPLILAETELLRFWFPLGWDLF